MSNDQPKDKLQLQREHYNERDSSGNIVKKTREFVTVVSDSLINKELLGELEEMKHRLGEDTLHERKTEILVKDKAKYIDLDGKIEKNRIKSNDNLDNRANVNKKHQ